MRFIYLCLVHIILFNGYIQVTAGYNTCGKYSNLSADTCFQENFIFSPCPDTIGNPSSYTIIRSSTGQGGSSKTFSTPNGRYTVNQSIGQASVTGTYSKNKYFVLQGYQQPLLFYKVIILPVENQLYAQVYPNPFSNTINVLFEAQPPGDILVRLFDASGRSAFMKKFAASKNITLLLTDLTKGIYMIHITTGNKTFSAKLIKE